MRDGDEPEVETLRSRGGRIPSDRNSVDHPLWGFKDPRTIRLLPFWHSVLHRLEVDECYLVMIRNPRSVATSLLQRQGMDARTAHLLWLAYMVPNLSTVASRPFIVTDYDLVMADPRRQLERIARGLNIPLNDSSKAGIEQFAGNFLDPNLRHSFFDPSDFETVPELGPPDAGSIPVAPSVGDRSHRDRFASILVGLGKLPQRRPETNRGGWFGVSGFGGAYLGDRSSVEAANLDVDTIRSVQLSDDSYGERLD